MESDAAEILRRQTQRLWHYQQQGWSAEVRATPTTALTMDQLRQAFDMCSRQPSIRDTMTRKHFVDIARILNTFYHKNYNPDFDDTIDELCCYFNSINSKFDEDKFKDAVCRRRE